MTKWIWHELRMELQLGGGLANCIHCGVGNGAYNIDSLWFVSLEHK